MSISIVAPAGGAPSPESYFVYAHFTLDTNESFYVGKGTRKRWQNAAGRSDAWKRHAKKHGVYTRMLVRNASPYAAGVLETTAIAMFGRRDLGQGSLLNRTNGGEGSPGHVVSPETTAKIVAKIKGREVSEETKAKIRAYFTPEVRQQMRERATGKPVSKATRAKLRAANLGKKASDATRAKMGAASTAAQKGKPKSTKARAAIAEAAARRRGIPTEPASAEACAKIREAKRARAKPVVMAGVRTFGSLPEACEWLRANARPGWGGGAKANPGGISHVLDHPTRKAYGYTWTRA